MTNTQNIILDLTNPHISPPPTVYAKQGDSGSRTVVAKIIDNGADVTTSAPCRVYFSGVGGGSPCYITGTVTSGAVTFTIPQTATMKSGTVKGEVQILNSDNDEEVIATMSFDLVVKQTAYNVGAIVGGGGVNLADQYVDDAISAHNISGEAHKNIQKNMSDLATEKANAALTAAQEYADIKANDGYSVAKAYTDSAVSAHNASGEAHGDIRDKIALLQKYPCYEYATSGGAVQRFDDVSVIPHNIGVTVHGATDENGNSVTNPTVSVYGKNMHVFNYKNIRGYTFSGSNCKIVNPTQFSENPNNPSLLLPAGTYTFSCRVTGSREYANKSNFSAFFYIGETQTNIDMNNFVSGTATFKTKFTVTEPTAFRFNHIWFIETPTSADMSLDFQLEVGSTATEYEPYNEPQTVTVPMSFVDGEVCEIGVLNAVSPTMTVVATDDNAVVSVVDVTYNRDVKKALDKLEAAIAAQA